MLPLDLLSANEAAREIASRVRTLRLHHGWTQVDTAARAGMTLASYKRFERTGEIAFKSLLKIAIAFGQLTPLDTWFHLPEFATLDEALARPKARVRAPRRRTA